MKNLLKNKWQVVPFSSTSLDVFTSGDGAKVIVSGRLQSKTVVTANYSVTPISAASHFNSDSKCLQMSVLNIPFAIRQPLRVCVCVCV